jgi:hypothetical protein
MGNVENIIIITILVSLCKLYYTNIVNNKNIGHVKAELDSSKELEYLQKDRLLNQFMRCI